MNNIKMSNQYICQYLLHIFRDLSILFTKTQLREPCFGISVSTIDRTTWRHTWGGSDVLRVRAWTNTLEPEVLLENMLHMLIHTYNKQNGISDMGATSNGRFHRRAYGETAEKFGLQVLYDKAYGYQIEKIPEEIQEECMRTINRYYPEIQKYVSLYMTHMADTPDVKRREYVTYQCPICKKKIKAMDNSYVICGVDRVVFERI